jgi:hypothetical protein
MNCSRGKRLVQLWCTVFAIAALPSFVLAQNIDTTGQFELDGNARSSTESSPYGPGADWQSFPAASTTPPAGFLVWTGVVSDPVVTDTTTFTGGGSKDIYDINKWLWTTGTTPDKDDIEHAYAAGYTDTSGHLIFVFGLDTFATNGARQVGFWFFKNHVSNVGGTCKANGTCTFVGKHADGDILVQSNFTIGGSVSNVTVFEWQSGALVQKFTGATACESGTATEACAIANTQNTPLYWSYTPKTTAAAPLGSCPSATNCAPPESFFEGGVDITAVLGPGSECFSTFEAETRSSTSFSSELEDFVFGSFNLCSIKGVKACTDPNNTAQVDATTHKFIYHFGGLVWNNGGGPLYATVTDTFPSDASAINPAGSGTGNVVSYDLGQVPAGYCQTWPTPGTPFACTGLPASNDPSLTSTGTFESATINPTNSADATGAITDGGATVTDSGSFTALCPPPPGGSIIANKGCSTSVNASTLKVTVNFSGTVINNSPYAITALTGTDVQNVGTGTANGGSVTFASTSLTACDVQGGCTSCPGTDPLTGVAPTYCTTYSGSYLPASASEGTTACSIAFDDTAHIVGTAATLNGTTGISACVYVNGTCTFPTDTNKASCPLCGCNP